MTVMGKKFIFIVLAFFVLGGGNIAPLVAGNGAPTTVLHLQDQVQMGAFRMKITRLEQDRADAATGEGTVFVPLLRSWVRVAFEGISVSDDGALQSGTVRAISNGTTVPNYHNTADEAAAFLEMAAANADLPRSLNDDLSAAGFWLNGHDMILSELVFAENAAWINASFLVQNPDGRVTTFNGERITLTDAGAQWCDAQFLLNGGEQTVGDDELPILIKSFNPDNETGTFVTFSCDGFEGFHLEGEYHFDTNHLRLVGQTAPSNKVIARFSIDTETWGQFTAAVSFNGTFEIVGVDDVQFTVSNAFIDYSDTANPTDTACVSYVNEAKNGTNVLLWRGFFVQNIAVKLPASLSINSGSRIELQAKNLIYDRKYGITTRFMVAGNPTLANGSLEGWGINVKDVSLYVRRSSPVNFNINGQLNIPLMKEQIPYTARFNFATGGNPGSGNAAASGGGISLFFEMNLNNTFTVPLLKDAQMVLTNSSAGFRYQSGKFIPHAHLNGKFNVDLGSGAAVDFKFSELGFQSLTLNYNAVTNQVVVPGPSDRSGGLQTVAIRAFSFAGQTFENTPNAPAQSMPVQEGGTSSPPQKVKGFPISVRNIKFGSENEFKKLDFTIAINFTSPSVGLTGSAALSIKGKFDAAKIITSAPWDALTFHSIALRSITIGSKAQPVNIGGVSLYGGLVVISKDPTFGDGFKGFLVMAVEPGITVDVVGQFGSIYRADNTLDYRYWFADARATIANGIRLGPAPLGVYGFGGGAYFNMRRSSALPSASGLNVSANSGSLSIPADGADPNISGYETPGVGLSGNYVPQKDIFGVNATVVLGTHPNAATANMDLTLNIEFNTNPFGLRTVSLRGDAYFMAPIAQRNNAKVKGTAEITYSHVERTLSFSGSISVNVTVAGQQMLYGGGNVAMFYNLNPGQGSDWYIAIGAPPLSRRMSLTFKLGSLPTQSVSSYFVAGNLQRLPAGQRDLPLLREYDPLLQQFESSNGLNFNQLMNGNGILMGMKYSYGVTKKIWIIQVGVNFTVGFDAILNQTQCAGHNPTGIDGWYIQGNIYGAIRGDLKIRVNLLFKKGTYTIASLSAAALVQAKLPNPTWMMAQIAGRYRILGGLVKGSFKLEVDFGEKCDPTPNILDAGDVVAKIKVIGDILPTDGTQEVPVFREKIIVTSFLENINGVMDFSEESDDGLKVMPVVHSLSFGALRQAAGTWSYLNSTGMGVGSTGLYNKAELNSTRLMDALSEYTFTARISWKQQTRDNPTWRDVILKDRNGNDSVQYFEVKTIKFRTANRPSILPREAILATYPEYGAINYCLFENPEGGGIALKLEGWGYLFNPKKRATDVTPCDENVVEYDYFLRVTDVATNRVASEKPLLAVPPPEWGKIVGDPIENTMNPCKTGNIFWDWIFAWLRIPCTRVTQGPCAVQQPTPSTAVSNVKNMSNNWAFGGSGFNFDLAVSQNADASGKNIGFPDVSMDLEKGKVYRFELVGKPIRNGDTYIVNTTQRDTVVTTGSGDYTVTSSSQTLTGQFSTGAPERILYKSEFGTSQYNNFMEKLGASLPELANTNALNLVAGDSYLFNNSQDFTQLKSDWSSNLTQAMMNEVNAEFAGYPVKDYLSEFIYNYAWSWFSTVNPNRNAHSYRLKGITEGFDFYEMSKLAYFAEYGWDTGFNQYMNAEHSNYRNYEKNNTLPFDESVVPKGSYQYLISFFGQNLLPANPTTKPNATELGLRFYPRTATIYRLMQMHWASLVMSSRHNKTLSNNGTQKLGQILPYDNVPNSYGDLFRLRYRKQNRTANMAFNRTGQTSSSYTDYSGTYYIRNVGSGRVVSTTSDKLSTNEQVDNNSAKITLKRLGNGNYHIEKYPPGWLSALSAQINNAGGISLRSFAFAIFSSPQEFTIIPLGDNTFKFQRAGANTFVYEDHVTKELKVGSGEFYDYDRFTLETTWEPAPTDLNQNYRVRVENNGRYWYNGNDRPQEALATTKDNKATGAHIRLRRRANGFYDFISTDGKRLHATTNNGGWIYSFNTVSGLSEDHYLFAPERVADNKYRWKNKQTGAWLYENFDLLGGVQHRYVLGSTTKPTSDESIFVLTEAGTYIAPDDLSGVYLIRNGGSGRYWHQNSGIINTITQENSAASRFMLKKVTSSKYEIWNLETQARVYFTDNGNVFRSDNSTQPAANGQFTLTSLGGNVYGFSDNNSRILYEMFDLNLGSDHRAIKSAFTNALPEPSEYRRYELIQEKDSDGVGNTDAFVVPNDLSGRYFIQTKGSERYLQYDPATPQFSEFQTGLREFVLRRRNGGADYDIWCRTMTNVGCLAPVTNGGYSFSGTTPNNTTLFTFAPDGDGWSIVHKSSGQRLYEHFEPGAANDKKLLSGASAGDHYPVFYLRQSDNTTAVYDGWYSVRNKATGKFWWDDNVNDTSPNFKTRSTPDLFLIRPSTNGLYTISSPQSNARLTFLPPPIPANTPNFMIGLLTSFKTRVSIGRNSDGSVRINFPAYPNTFFTDSGNGQINVGPYNNANSDFYLTPQPPAVPTNLSGEYVLQTQGSGRYWAVAPDGTARVGTTERRFVLQRRSGDIYEIKDKTTQQRLHAQLDASNNWLYTTAPATGLPDNYYQFSFAPGANGTFSIKNLANQQFLSEYFDLNTTSTKHGQILSSLDAADDYGLFLLQTTFAAPPENISGTWYLKNQERYIHAATPADGGLLTNNRSQVDDAYIRYVLKRRASGQYEIWSLGNGLPVQPPTTLVSANVNTSANAPGSLYTLTKINNQYRISHRWFGLGVTGAGKVSTISYNGPSTLFALETAYLRPNNLSGEYLLRSVASLRYIHYNGTVLTTSRQDQGNTLRFILEYQPASGAYKIKLKNDGKYLHLEADGTYSTKDANVPANNYLFKLHPQSNNAFALSCLANNAFLYENFDLLMGPTHRQILGNTTLVPEYGVFTLETAYQNPNFEDLSGDYVIGLPNNGRVWTHAANGIVETGWPTADNPSLHFIFKRRASGKYEIWNRQNQKQIWLSLGTTNRLTTGNQSPAVGENQRLFTVTRLANNQVQMQLDNQFLAEVSMGNLSTASAAQSFNLSATYTPPSNVSLNGFLVVRGSRRYCSVAADGSLGAVWQSNNPGSLKFILEPQPNNAYKIKHIATNQYLYVTANGGLGSVPSSGVSPQAYLFNLVEQSAFAYRIQSRLNNLFLSEIFGSGAGAANSVRCVSNANDDYLIFELKDTYVPNQGEDISGAWFMRFQGSERYLSEMQSGTRIASDNMPVSWLVKPRSNQEFELLTADGQRKLAFTVLAGFHTVGVNASVPGEGDRFKITRSGDLFEIRKALGNQLLFEQFDVNLGALNYLVRAGNSPAMDDARLEFSRQPKGNSPNPIFSTPVILQSQATNLNWVVEPGKSNVTLAQNGQNNLNTRFVFRYRRGGLYEVWNQGTGQRYQLNSSQLMAGGNAGTVVVLEPSGTNYLIKIQSNNQYLADQLLFNPTPSAVVSPNNNASDAEKLWRIGGTMPDVNFTNDLSGTYGIRVSGTSRRLRVQNNEIRSGTSDAARFYLRRLASGNYEIWQLISNSRCGISNNNFVPSSPNGPSFHFTLQPVTASEFRIFAINGTRLTETSSPVAGTGIFSNPVYQLRFSNMGSTNLIDKFIFTKL